MILNPSHEITLKGLPSEILDAYVRYKKGSRAIVSWLVQFGHTKYKGVKTLPIKELASLAHSVTHLIKELPEVVHFYFKETIAARRRLSQYFRKSIDLSVDDTDTVNHEHFTTSLSQIYSDLCEHCQGQKKHKTADRYQTGLAAIAEPIRNHYECLPVEEALENPAMNSNEEPCHECQHKQSYQCPGPQVELGIEDDEISIAIETASILERIHDTITVVEKYWQQTGRGETHFVSAAGVTNIAWSTLRDLDTELREDGEVLSLSILHQRCCVFRENADDSDSALAKVHILLESLEESDRSICHYTNSHKLAPLIQCPSCIQKPLDYVQRSATADRERPTTTFSLALLHNILHLICGTQPTAIITQSSPVYAEIGYLLTHQDDQSTSFRCMLGIHLLAVAYKAYLSALPKPSTVSICRITALKLSKQAHRVISTILDDKDSFPCKCPQTLAFHLSNLKDDMDVYSKHKCWDLYFQSPWVAGNHIIEMLDILSYYGMRLFHYRHYIGAMLHSYNVLIQLGGLTPIPILEQFCGIFREVFFPSGRPESNFKNCWARYIGARLKFKKGHRKLGSDRESWCMAVPAHAARNAAGFGIATERGNAAIEPKFDYARIDPMMKLKQQGWTIDMGSSEVDHHLRRQDPKNSYIPPSSSPATARPSSRSSASSSTPSESETSLPSTSTDSSPSTHRLLTTLSTLTSHLPPSSSSSPTSIPTTPLSHLQIFQSTLTLIRTITSKTHTEPSDTPTPLCICFAHTLLSAADRIVEARRFGGIECWKREEREVVEVVKGAMVGVFSEKGVGEWVWEI